MPKRKKYKKRVKKTKKTFLPVTLLVVFSLWALLPHFLGRGVDISGFEYGSADGTLLTGATLNDVFYRNKNIEIFLPEVEINGAAPFGSPFQISSANGEATLSGRVNNIDAVNLELEIQPLITDLKLVQASFMGGEVFVVGKGRIYNFEKKNGTPITFWDCLLVATTPEGLKIAEGVLQMPLESHLARWKLPEDAIDGTAGEVVDAISGWFAKQVGKLMKDYIFLELEANPKLELTRVSHISTKEIQKESIRDSWDLIWSKHSGAC